MPTDIRKRPEDPVGRVCYNYWHIAQIAGHECVWLAHCGVVPDAASIVAVILEDYRAVELALSARLPKVA